jgi:hypothetical protein
MRKIMIDTGYWMLDTGYSKREIASLSLAMTRVNATGECK